MPGSQQIPDLGWRWGHLKGWRRGGKVGERMGRQAPPPREAQLIHTVKQRQLSWAPGARETGPAGSTDDPNDPQSTGDHQRKTK